MILIDLKQNIIDDVFRIFAEIVNLEDQKPPLLADVSAALQGETRRFVVEPVIGHPYKPELWFSEDVNKNIIFTFTFPADIVKGQQEKAEIAKTEFDKRLQAYLIDYYL
jgi:hypothetical protein